MIDEEEYLMLRELAQEQEITTGRVNICALSKQMGYDRKTIRKYLSPRKSPLELHRQQRKSKLDPFKDHLRQRLEQFPRLSSVRLLEEIQSQGYTGRDTILKDYLRAVRPKPTTLAEIRYETKPGVQAQVDWSDCIYVLPDGTRKKVYCFSMVLGYSRMRYVEFHTTTNLTTFLKCHQNAFEYFGGVTQEILYDNIKVVVINRKNPSTASDFHPAFVDLRDHYAFTAYLCRPYRAKTKGKIERAIGFVKDNFIYGRIFSSIDDLNNQARQWMEKVNHQVHGTTFEIPADRFPKENLRSISSIPPYLIKRYEERLISKDCYVSLYGNRYSVPWQYARRNAGVEVIDQRVLIAVDGTVICEHPLLEGRHETSRKKEHFEGLLKAIRDETRGKMPPVITRTTTVSTSSVEKRSLSEYDQLCRGAKDAPTSA
ncbi:MAG: IS21 family transposase [Methanomicrobiales archaeon]|nr:IS21 family transposase [Methanomicrobiales archaeon]